jgi:hypothetical protein
MRWADIVTIGSSASSTDATATHNADDRFDDLLARLGTQGGWSQLGLRQI